MKRALLAIALVFAAIAAPAQIQPKSGFFTTSDGVRIHYLEAGKGPSIVFIPGWTMPAWIWEKQIVYFSPKYHVVAVDPRSQGDSGKAAEGNYPERRARDYKELVDHLKLAPVVLVGWSMGVAETFAYVDQFGASDLRGIALVDGFVVADESVLKTVPLWLRTLAMDRNGFTDRFVRSMYKKPQPEGYFVRVEGAALQTPSNTAVELVTMLIARPDWSAVFPKLARTPVLYVGTTRLEKQVDVLRGAVPNLQSEVFDDAGHALFVDDAERFNAALARFLHASEQQVHP